MDEELYLEHANITVESIEETIEFLVTAFPNFKIRGKGDFVTNGVTRSWLHFGTETTYIAIESISPVSDGKRNSYRDVGINHLGFVVKDMKGVEQRLKDAGYKKSIDVEPHPFRKRCYFYDKSGIEYEFIEYLSDNVRERNKYD